MTKELALNIIKLLSALEVLGLTGTRTPDYLDEQLTDIIDKLKNIVLEGE